MRTSPPPVEYSDPKDIHQLWWELGARLHKAMVDFAAEGGKGAYLNSGKRTDYMQWLLRLGRVPRGQEWNPAYKGSPLTAIPGRSDHRNLSFAISAADIGGTAFKRWLRARQARYGVRFDIPSEDWHITCWGTPQVHCPPLGGVPVTPPRPDPTPTPNPQELTVADIAAITTRLDGIVANLEVLQVRMGDVERLVIESKSYAKADGLDDLSDKEQVEFQKNVAKLAAAEIARLKAARAK